MKAIRARSAFVPNFIYVSTAVSMGEHNFIRDEVLVRVSRTAPHVVTAVEVGDQVYSSGELFDFIKTQEANIIALIEKQEGFKCL